MSSEIFTGVVGLVGALVGGGVTMATSYLNARGQRQWARIERDHQVMDAQRDACVTFLKQADLFLDHARALAGALEGTTEADKKAELYGRYETEWVDFIASNSALQVAGPPALADAGQNLRRVSGEWADVLDHRYQGRRWPADKVDKQKAAWQARRHFVGVAQQVFGSSEDRKAASAR